METALAKTPQKRRSVDICCYRKQRDPGNFTTEEQHAENIGEKPHDIIFVNPHQKTS